MPTSPSCSLTTVGTVHTAAQITGKAASMGDGVVSTVLDALIRDFTGKLATILVSVAVRAMREVQPGETPVDGGIAVQEHPGRPVFRGHGTDDYLCVSCGNLLAQTMDPPI